MQIIDTHCHLDVPEFDADREQVLAASRAAGVSAMLVPGIRQRGWPGLCELCRAHADLHPALGLHPVYLAEHRPEHLDTLREYIERERPVAVGEIGLDFFVRDLDQKQQQFYFEAQLAIAREYRLPVVLHVRKSHEQMLRTLKRFDLVGGTAHAFNGSLQQAEQYAAMNFKLGFGGMLTYERSSRLRRLARDIPLDWMVLETDAPDLTVASHQYQRNSPEYLPEVLAALAEVKQLPEEEVARVTSDNARALFGL